MKKALLIIVFTFSCCLLAACSDFLSIEGTEEQMNTSVVNIAEWIPAIKSTEEISVFLGYTSPAFLDGRVYAVTSAEEQMEILKVIMDINVADFIDADMTDIGGQGFTSN